MKPLFKKNRFLGEGILLLASLLLFLLSFLFNKIYSARSVVSTQVKEAEAYLSRHAKDFERLLKDTALVRRLVEKREAEAELNRLTAKDYGIFLYRDAPYDDMLRFWNEQLILPPEKVQEMPDGEAFMKLSNGYYYVIRRTLNEPIETVAYAMILVKSSFFIVTEYLPERFTFSEMADKRVELKETATEYPVRSPSGKTLFYLEKKIGGIPYNSSVTMLLRLAGFFLLMFFIFRMAERQSQQGRKVRAIALLAGSLLLLRLIIYQFPGLLNLRQFELFDPTVYGSNIIQRSLGDLLINALLLCWVIIYSWPRLSAYRLSITGWPEWKKWTTGVAALCLLIYSTFIIASVIRSIVADSKISFDVTNFFSLTIYSLVGFIILACLSLTYYYFTQLLFRVLVVVFKGRQFLIYIAIAFTGLVYLTIRSGHREVLFYLPVLLWLIAYTWLVSREGLIMYRIRFNIAGILFWIFVFSLSIAAIMLKENEEAEWQKRRIYAEKLALKTDPSSERLMRIAITYLDNDYLSDNFHRFYDSTENRYLRDSIVTSNYSGYLDKYDTRLYVYDSAGSPIGNDDATTYDALNTIVKVQSRPTGIEDLFYYEKNFDKFAYITERTVTDSAKRKIGSFFIISNPKKYSSDALFPEMFRQYKNEDMENSPIYSYAVYGNRHLLSSSSNYPFPTSLVQSQVPKEEVESRTNGDYNELWFRVSHEKVVVMARKRDTFIESITLFSYIFCSFLILVTFVQLISFLFKAGYRLQELKRLFQLSIRTQVHNTFIFVSVFSFVVIGVATISFFIRRYEKNNSDKLSRTMNIMVNEMQKKADADLSFINLPGLQEESGKPLQRLVEEISDIHGVDVNVYDLNGNLLVSSQKDVYTKGVLSNKIDPQAFYHLSRLRQKQHVQKERVADLSFMSIYAPVRDDDGRVYAYLGIPYFTSQLELTQEISNFLVTIINLNAFIFLIAGLIALFITNRITSSFSLISDKMREVNLSKVNEMIVWNREDEIGELVKEYNKMVGKLEESAILMAKTEREGAWREMARQVAHEIKNPLTPMKLSLQYLQKAIDSNQANVRELTGNVANTLVEQIDHLAKIAADFSQFANIGNTKVEIFDLHEVIASLKSLYSSNTSVEFSWRPLNRSAVIAADRTQMNRLFTNLLVNAMDACKENGKCRIEVAERISGDSILVSVTDNGEGIPVEMQPNIFVPNFTTKTSGTGLGLAMCKGIVEQARGDIWFETEAGKGTSFFVRLPLQQP